MKQPGADVLSQSWVVEQDDARHHQPGGTGSIERAIAAQVRVFGQGSCCNERVCLAKDRDQVEGEDVRAPPLCREEGSQEGNDDDHDDAVDRLAPLEV